MASELEAKAKNRRTAWKINRIIIVLKFKKISLENHSPFFCLNRYCRLLKLHLILFFNVIYYFV